MCTLTDLTAGATPAFSAPFAAMSFGKATRQTEEIFSARPRSAWGLVPSASPSERTNNHLSPKTRLKLPGKRALRSGQQKHSDGRSHKPQVHPHESPRRASPLPRSSRSSRSSPMHRGRRERRAGHVRRGSTEPQVGLVDFGSILRNDIWTDPSKGGHIERYVGVNPRAARAADWHSSKLPRSQFPPPRAPVPDLAQKQSTLMAPPSFDSSIATQTASQEQVAADEVRWGCRSNGSAAAKALHLFGYSNSVHCGSAYLDPEEIENLLGVERSGRYVLGSERKLSPEHKPAVSTSTVWQQPPTSQQQRPEAHKSPTAQSKPLGPVGHMGMTQATGSDVTSGLDAAGIAGQKQEDRGGEENTGSETGSITLLLTNAGIPAAPASAYASHLVADGFDSLSSFATLSLGELQEEFGFKRGHVRMVELYRGRCERQEVQQPAQQARAPLEAYKAAAIENLTGSNILRVPLDHTLLPPPSPPPSESQNLVVTDSAAGRALPTSTPTDSGAKPQSLQSPQLPQPPPQPPQPPPQQQCEEEDAERFNVSFAAMSAISVVDAGASLLLGSAGDNTNNGRRSKRGAAVRAAAAEMSEAREHQHRQQQRQRRREESLGLVNTERERRPSVGKAKAARDTGASDSDVDESFNDVSPSEIDADHQHTPPPAAPVGVTQGQDLSAALSLDTSVLERLGAKVAELDKINALASQLEKR